MNRARAGQTFCTHQRYTPVVAHTRSARRPEAPSAYDCVRVVIIRDGSVFISGECVQPVTVGDAALFASRARFGPTLLSLIENIFTAGDVTPMPSPGGNTSPDDRHQLPPF